MSRSWSQPPVQLGKLRLREVSGPLEVPQLVQGWDVNDQQSLGRQGGKGAPKRGHSQGKSREREKQAPVSTAPLSSQQTTWKWLSNDRMTRSQKTQGRWVLRHPIYIHLPPTPARASPSSSSPPPSHRCHCGCKQHQRRNMDTGTFSAGEEHQPLRLSHPVPHDNNLPTSA